MTPDDPIRFRTDYLRLRGALFDRITGLPALPLVFDELRALLDRRRSVGLLHVSIPALALTESVYGWQVFDSILGRMAKRLGELKGSLLPADTRLAQTSIHGSEIIAVLPGGESGGATDPVALARVSSELEADLRALFEGEEFATIVPRLEPRVGSALVCENPFYRFERLVYRAVEEARTQAVRRDERRRSSWKAEIQQLIRDEGIGMVYQPILDLGSLEVIGYEALARGPAGSALESPAMMFRLSEQNGISADLDRLCRRLALSSAGGIGPGRKLFINTRPDHLADPDWGGARIEKMLANLGLGQGDIVVEIPDMGASVEQRWVERFVHDLKGRGFLFAIDDMGTGYSSLQAIENLAPDFLKMDISLVRDIDAHLIQQDILVSLLSIGQRIGAQVIAEGIESRAELECLRGHGARYGQGFLFAPAARDFVEGPIQPGREH